MTAWVLIFYVAGINGGELVIPAIESEKACLELYQAMSPAFSNHGLNGRPRCISYRMAVKQ